MMSATGAAKRSILWFRNNLRIHDNPLLNAVNLDAVDRTHELICFYCFDPRFYRTTKFRNIKQTSHKTKFLIESIVDLRNNIEKLGGTLVIHSNLLYHLLTY